MGKKVAGFFCSLVPVCLLTAHSLVPAPAPRQRARVFGPRYQLNLRTREHEFRGDGSVQARIRQKGSTIWADRILWNEKTEIGRCYGNVRIIDYTNKVEITGGYAWHNARKGHSIMRRKPVLYLKQQKITVYAREMHRYLKRRQAVGIGNVRIYTEDGHARGERAVYETERKLIRLSGNPTLHQKGDVHRADYIDFFMDEKKVVLQDNAKLAQGPDYILADRIVLFDLEDDSKSKEKKSTPKTKTKKKKNRLAYYYGHVRVYRYKRLRGGRVGSELESITTGGYGEYHEKADYARMMVEPKMILVEDNTIVNAEVMEQFRNQDLALAKGNVRIIKEYRTINGQLARYYYNDKKIILTGNPVITEYNDKYRADVVIYDTEKDLIRWYGTSMAIIGSGAQSDKERAWAKQLGGVLLSLMKGNIFMRVTAVVGDVFLSSSGTIKTNEQGENIGQRAVAEDSLGKGAHVVVGDDFGWCDMISDGRDMVRLKGDSVLYLEDVETLTLSSNQVQSNQAAAKNRDQAAKDGTGATQATNTNHQADGRDGPGQQYSLFLKEGMVLLKPHQRSSGVLVCSTPEVQASNVTAPLLISFDTNQGSRLVLIKPQARTDSNGRPLPVKAGPLTIRLRLAPLALLQFSVTNERREFWKDVEPFLGKELPPDRMLTVDHLRFQTVQSNLNLVVTNHLAELRRIAATNTNSNTNARSPSATGPRQDPALRPGKGDKPGKPGDPNLKKASDDKPKQAALNVRYTPELRSRLLAVLRRTRSLVHVHTIPKRDMLLQDRLQELRTFRAYRKRPPPIKRKKPAPRRGENSKKK